MYYQVGNSCLEASQAQNVYFSLVVPSISSDGVLHRPEFDGAVWRLNGQVLKASLPECNPADNFKSGADFGWALFGLAASVFFVTVIRRLMR